MIQIPEEEMIKKIIDKSNLSQEQIEQRINQKMEQLSGLISREGALHIIANELGIKLLEEVTGHVQIKNILTGMRNIEVLGKAVQVYPVREFKKENREGKVINIVLGDETGTTRIVAWGSKAEELGQAKENDIVEIKRGHVKENQGRKEVHINDRAEININPSGKTIGEVKTTPQPMIAQEAERKEIAAIKKEDRNVEIIGTVVQAYDVHFFEVCPECGKRTRLHNEQFACDFHGVIQPAFSYVMNAIVDDGTETVRLVCFRDQAEKLLKAEKEAILTLRNNPEEQKKRQKEVVGSLVRIQGRVSYNQMFDRLDFIANNIEHNPDPEKEIKRLKIEVEKSNS